MKKVSDLDYISKTPDRRKARQLCHINMIKAYHDRNFDKIMAVRSTPQESGDDLEHSDKEVIKGDYHVRLSNSEILAHLDLKLAHLSPMENKN